MGSIKHAPGRPCCDSEPSVLGVCGGPSIGGDPAVLFTMPGETTGTPHGTGYYPDLAIDFDGYALTAPDAGGGLACWLDIINATKIVTYKKAAGPPLYDCGNLVGHICCWQSTFDFGFNPGLGNSTANHCWPSCDSPSVFHATGLSVGWLTEEADAEDEIDGEPTVFYRAAVSVRDYNRVSAMFSTFYVMACAGGSYLEERGDVGAAVKIDGTWYVPPKPIDFGAGVDLASSFEPGEMQAGDSDLCGSSTADPTYSGTIRVYSP